MFKRGRKTEGVDALLPEEPAGQNYFIKQCFIDFKTILNDSKLQHRVAIDALSLRGVKLRDFNNAWAGAGMVKRCLLVAKSILLFFARLSARTVGLVLTMAILALHFALTCVVSVAVRAIAGLVGAIDGLYRRGRNVAVVCDRCKTKSELPGYVCPGCGAVHYRLAPNVHGIFVHRCTCGQKLPATFFSRTKNAWGATYRRRDLDAVCGNPTCNAEVFATESRPFSLTVAGGPSVGKTAYITAVACRLTENVLPQAGCTVSYCDAKQQAAYADIVRDFNAGETAKTIESVNRDDPSAFSLNFLVEHPKLKPERFVHLMDIAGETFVRGTEHERQLQYSYAGVVFIVDPMAVSEVRDAYAAKLDSVDAQSIGQEDPNQVLATLVAKSQSANVLAQGQRVDVPVAIVLNKVDQPGLRDVFSDEAVAAWRMAHENCDAAAAVDGMCREFLRNNHMGNFVTTVDVNFKTVRYFMCSAIGHSRGAGAYQPRGVLAPVQWIASLTDKQFAAVLGGTIE